MGNCQPKRRAVYALRRSLSIKRKKFHKTVVVYENHEMMLVQEEIPDIDMFMVDNKPQAFTSGEGKLGWLIQQIHSRKRAIEVDSLRFSSAEIQRLSVVLSTTRSLNKLILSNCLINNSGAKHLAWALKSPNCGVRVLNLSENFVRDEGAEALVRNAQQLSHLDLSSNLISNTGALRLYCIIKQRSCIRRINLNLNNGISLELMEQIDLLNKTMESSKFQCCLLFLGKLTKPGKPIFLPNELIRILFSKWI